MAWVRIDCNLEMDRKFRKLSGVGRAVLQFLWRLAKQKEGRIAVDDLDPEYIADMTCFVDSLQEIETSINDIVTLGFLEIFESGPDYYVHNWCKLQKPKDRTNALRQRKHREKKKKEEIENVTVVTARNAPVTDSNGVTERYETCNGSNGVHTYSTVRTVQDSTDSVMPAPLALTAPDAKKSKKTAKKTKKQPAKSSAAWKAYSDAFQRRYNSTPIRSAGVNAVLCKIIDQVGSGMAPALCEHFVGLDDYAYTNSGHNVKTLLYHINKVKVSYDTGYSMTQQQARNLENESNVNREDDDILAELEQYNDAQN